SRSSASRSRPCSASGCSGEWSAAGGSSSRVRSTRELRDAFARKDIWRSRVGPPSLDAMTALLLAEPEPAVRGFLERQLRNDGFDVVACERAEQLPRAADPDVLLLGDA